jgi:4-hydroxy-tetrahydrodipicolinate synthase
VIRIFVTSQSYAVRGTFLLFKQEQHPMTDFRRASRQTFTPLLTYFNDTGIDHAALEAAVDRQIVAGVDGIVVCDAVGEGWALTQAEREEVIKTSVRRGGQHLSVIAATGTNCTRTTIERSLRALDLGVDALMITVPYYSKPTMRGVADHFREIAGAASAPIIVDDNPARTAIDPGVKLLDRLAEIPSIIGVCHGFDRISHFLHLSDDLRKRFVHLTRDDAALFDFLEHGGTGIVSPLANIVPSPVQTLVSMSDGVASPLGHLIMRAAELLEREDVAALKEACSFIHQTSADVRLPLVPSEPETIVRLRHTLAPFARSEGGIGIAA